MGCSCFRVFRHLFRFALVLLVLFVIGSLIGHTYAFWDDDKDRGAQTVTQDEFGDHYDKVVYLPQNWKPQDSLWFYGITQGSDLMPYDFFLALEQADNDHLFRDNDNINRYRYLARRPTFSNPDGLPVGMTKDTYQGKAYMGFTCAACHTGQINYQGTAIRVDGAPGGGDMESFMVDLAAAMKTTLKGADADATPGQKAKLERFVSKVLDKGCYSDRKDVLADLRSYTQRVYNYTVVNRPGNSERVNGEAAHPMTHYGYYRLDAFGRIFNRVLEHVMNAEQLRQILHDVLPADEINAVMKGAEPILSADNRDNIIEKLEKVLNARQMLRLRNAIYNPPDAPVSYPFLWGIPQSDYVQWNGIVANAGVGPIGRNAGQVIGVFGTLDWKALQHPNLSTILGGQPIGGSGPWVDYRSSLNIRNLQRVEHELGKLESPEWPENILGKIDRQRAERGGKIFDRYCASCHTEIDRASPTRHVIAQMIDISKVGTDPKMAHNSVTYSGYSGILKDEYVPVSTGNLLIQQTAPVAALLTQVTRNVGLTPDPDKWWIVSWVERLYDFFVTFFDNKVKASVKRGDYTPDTTLNPFASLTAYKGRSLNGIWATAPYLHNGSVPTLYDLLLPQKCSKDHPDCEHRPETFMVGSREFDPLKVGFKSEGYDGFKFLTSIPGNGNGGHEYAAGRTPQLDGTLLPALDREQRLDLLEYLKTL